MTATDPASPQPKTPSRQNRRQSRPRRWIPYVLGILLIALLIAGFLPQPALVESARVTRGVLQATINEEGETRIRQRYVVSAPVTGQLRRIPFKAGAHVKADKTILATMDPIRPSPLDARTRALTEARRDAAAANVEKARTAHRFARTDLERFERLFANATVSEQELESFQWREAETARELAAAESALREVEAELAEFDSASTHNIAGQGHPIEIRAPVGGRILRVLEENARVVNAGTPLLEVGDPTDLEVVIDVLSRDGAELKPGAAILLHQWGGNEPLKATLRLVEPAAFTKVSALGVEEQRVNVIADLLTPPEERPGLGDQFRVEAHIVVWETDQTLKVPSGALFRRGVEWAVFVIDGGRARLRPVRVGRSSGTEVQVIEGLNEGEELVLYPGDRITDGQRVKPVQISP
jgi:HlyD family secretion protein